MAMIRFLEGRAGRIARILAGLILLGVGVGLSLVSGGVWWVLAMVGAIPLVSGLLGVCLLGPIFHEPLRPGRAA